MLAYPILIYDVIRCNTPTVKVKMVLIRSENSNTQVSFDSLLQTTVLLQVNLLTVVKSSTFLINHEVNKYLWNFLPSSITLNMFDVSTRKL